MNVGQSYKLWSVFRMLEFRIFGQMALGFFGQMVAGVLDKPQWASSEHDRVAYHFTAIIMVVS